MFNSLNDIIKTMNITHRLGDVKHKVEDTTKDIAEKAKDKIN
jgi:hypothetical protein